MKTKKLFRNSSGHLRAAWRTILYIAPVIALFKFVDKLDDLIFIKGDELSDYSLLLNRFIEKFLLLICVLIPGIALLKWLDKRPLRLLGIGLYKKALPEFLLGMLISVIIIPLSALILYLLGFATFTYNGFSSVSLLYLLCSLLVVIVMAGYEEVLFRGYIFQALIEGSNIWIALVIYSLLFGAAHLSNKDVTVISVTFTIFAGAMLGILYYKTRSLWACIGTHFMWNWLYGAIFGVAKPDYLQRTLLTYKPLDSGFSLSTDDIYEIILVIFCLIFTILIWRAKWLRPDARNKELWLQYPSRYKGICCK